MTTAAARVLEAVGKAKLRPATMNDPPQDTYDALWSVVTRVAGDRLAVAASKDPSTFAAMEHQTTATVVLESAAEVVGLLRRAASELALPEGARAVPFSLLEGGGAHEAAATRICAVAVPGFPGVAVAVVWGSTFKTTVNEAIVFGEDEVVSVVVDQFGDFGRVSNRWKLSAVARIDLDATMLTIAPAAGAPQTWQLQRTPPDDLEAARALAQRRAIPLRRLVQVDPTTREWR